MSERAGLAGGNQPPFTIEHKGKVYTLTPVLDDNVMLAVERQLYDRERLALEGVKSSYAPERYEDELAKLRKRFADGDFGMESEATLGLMKTKKGSLLLLRCMLGSIGAAEMVELMANKGPELMSTLQDILALTFPKFAEKKRRERDKQRRQR
jgi:hypothetical protein